MRAYKEAFRPPGQKVAQVLLTRDDLANRRRYLNARNTLMTLLDHGITPIINENDTVVVDEIRFGDNDNLSAMVTNLVEANLLVILSDVDGLFDRDPAANPGARLIPVVERITAEIEATAGDTGTDLGTGGMATKVKAAKRATLYGVGTVIVNGRAPRVLCPPLRRRGARDLFPAGPRPDGGQKALDRLHQEAPRQAVPRRRRQTRPGRGRQEPAPFGYPGVEGGFERGDAVRLCDLEGKEFAMGVINYSLAELLRIMGKKTSEIEGILGYKYGDEVVHRDNLVLNK